MIHSTRVSVREITGALGRIVCVALFTSMLAACTRGVQWEEEVVLNTGETIVVERQGTYTFILFSGASGFIGYAPDWRSTIEFTYKGRRYRHTDELSPVLLAIAPDGTPNLVASLGSEWGWKHKYYCVTPYYVQLRPDQSGKEWSWPDEIEPWLYDLPTNLLIGIAPMEADGKKLGPVDRKTMNASLTAVYKYFQVIDQTHTVDFCPRRTSP